VSVEEVQQSVLPASVYSALPAPFGQGTYLWGYRVGDMPSRYPGFTTARDEVARVIGARLGRDAEIGAEESGTQFRDLS
jgi:hypothetical protein